MVDGGGAVWVCTGCLPRSEYAVVYSIHTEVKHSEHTKLLVPSHAEPCAHSSGLAA